MNDAPRRAKRRAKRTHGHLIVSDLSYHNGGTISLEEISLEARPGTTTHIIGPSTTQSSALLGLLVGLYPPERGTIHLDGTAIGDLPLRAARTAVALVLQDPWIMSGSVAENIAFGDPGVGRDRIELMARLACVDQFTSRLPDGLDTTIGEDGDDLTDGQRRRIALARALIRNPDLLLLEDPLRGLSAREETQAIKAINRAGADRTMIITAGEFDATVFSATQVLSLDQGRLAPVEIDPFDEPTPRVRPQRRPPPEKVAMPAASLDVGTEIGAGYTAAGLLQRRANTETWLAWQAETATIVEVKLPRHRPASEAALTDLTEEYSQATRLQHPGLTRPLEAHLAAPVPFTVYERIDGPLLTQTIGQRIDALDPFDVQTIGAELARTLAYLHRLGHAHLDLGPHVVRRSTHGTVITDLRHARRFEAAQPGVDESDRRAGLAPEQRRGDPATAAMDLYALGALLFQAVTGSLLSAGETADLASLDDTVPSPLADAIARLLAPDPKDRPSAAEALALLRPLPPPVTNRPGQAREPLLARMRRRFAARIGTATVPRSRRQMPGDA